QRTGRLLDELRIARGDGSYSKLLRQLARLDLLILDDFGLKPLSQTERHDLLEIIEDRHDAHSTIITSQLPIGSWHTYLNEPTVADALLDRLLTNAHRLELKGESLRSEEHTSELQSLTNLVCRLLLEQNEPTPHYHAAAPIPAVTH